MIQYPKGQEAQAKAVAAVVPGATAVLSTTVSGVTLVLGTDGHTVATTASSGTGTGTATGTGTGATTNPKPAAPSKPAPASPSTKPVGNAYGDQGTCIN
ncbi:Uncharacterised protein [Mycobacteroides abscessus subsp. abscessus]|nr:Uncharacterised protein [Mycobacteroides abscessus subsp. abscessus]